MYNNYYIQFDVKHHCQAELLPPVPFFCSLPHFDVDIYVYIVGLLLIAQTRGNIIKSICKVDDIQELFYSCPTSVLVSLQFKVVKIVCQTLLIQVGSHDHILGKIYINII